MIFFAKYRPGKALEENKGQKSYEYLQVPKVLARDRAVSLGAVNPTSFIIVKSFAFKVLVEAQHRAYWLDVDADYDDDFSLHQSLMPFGLPSFNREP